MKDILDKLSSYNIFNYLLPGIIFCVLADTMTSYRFLQKDIVTGVFIYYFIGLIISRVGSTVIEPILIRTKFIKYSSYNDFVSVSKIDSKMEVLSETNNMFRTFASLFILLPFLKLTEFILKKFSFLNNWDVEFLVVILLILFSYSYRKQSQYINGRIMHHKGKK